MNDDTKGIVALDLDALAPAKVQISYNSKLISVTPPTLEQFAAVMEYSDEMSKVSDKSADYKQVADLYVKIKAFIYECIPDLKGEPLNVTQIAAIFEVLGKLGEPSDRAVEELKARGIELKSEASSDPKDSASPEQ